MILVRYALRVVTPPDSLFLEAGHTRTNVLPVLMQCIHVILLYIKVEEKRKHDAECGNEIAKNLEGFIHRKVGIYFQKHLWLINIRIVPLVRKLNDTTAYMHCTYLYNSAY